MRLRVTMPSGSLRCNAMESIRVPLLVAAALWAGAAAADEARPFCVNRPGKVTPPCILDTGKLQIEVGLVDAALTRQPGNAVDNWAFGATVVRLGLRPTTEVQLGWTPFALSHMHSGGGTMRGVGDVSLALRQSLLRPDGSGVSVAVQPFVTAPTATGGQGAGDWTGGVLLPFAAALPAGFGFAATPEIDLYPNASGHGSHAAFTGVVAVSHPIGAVTLGAELWGRRNDDPDQPVTQVSADFSAAWVPKATPNLQFDIGANAGLNRNTAEIELYVGVATRF